MLESILVAILTFELRMEFAEFPARSTRVAERLHFVIRMALRAIAAFMAV